MEDMFSPEFWLIVASKQREGQRKGQAIYNTAAEFHRKETSLLCGTSVDPFYQDGNIPYFLEELADRLTR